MPGISQRRRVLRVTVADRDGQSIAGTKRAVTRQPYMDTPSPALTCLNFCFLAKGIRHSASVGPTSPGRRPRIVPHKKNINTILICLIEIKRVYPW